MNRTKLKNLDLNLLKCVHVILDEGNITKAAAKLNITQPALSNALARARELLNDELLVRQGRVMVPTPYANRIKKPLGDALRCLITEVLPTKDFDPHLDSFRFVTAFRGYEEVLLMPQILSQISRYSGLSLFNRQPKTMDSIEELCHGKIHFTITPNPSPQSGIMQKLLLVDEFVCAASIKFPLEQLTLDSYCNYPHLLLSLHGGEGIFDEVLAKVSKGRLVKMAVSEFGTIPRLLCLEKCLLATVPMRLARIWVQEFPLKILPCPMKALPLKLYLSWHANSKNSSAIMWFKTVIENAVRFDIPRAI